MRGVIPITLWMVIILGMTFGAVPAAGPQQRSARGVSRAPSTSLQASSERALLNQYCFSCHNQRLKTAGLTLDTLDVENIGAHAETWEKVVRKLRASAMPPVGLPRPEKSGYDGLISWLEGELDTAAAAAPNPGKAPTFHRLNRTEYQNAVRDLLALEIDAASLLPADDAAFGFDNIGEALTVSPDLLDSYLSAANKISRLAVGDSRLESKTYGLSKYHLQDHQMNEDLPFGSRGGLAVRHYFPYDGEYVIKVRVDGGRGGPQADTVEIRIDGARVAALTTGGRGAEDPEELGAVETRVRIKAGLRVVGASFPRAILPAETRFPQFYPWGHSAVFNTTTGAARYVKVFNVVVTGPYVPAGPGSTPSRQRIFQCQPTTAQEKASCAAKILGSLARSANRRPVSDRDVAPLLAAYKTRQGDGFEHGVQAALERLLVDPEFIFRVESNRANVKPGAVYALSDVELASRLSFFLWSSIPDDKLLELAERGELKRPAVFEQQVRRMLADERAKALVNSFAAQWLFLRNVRLGSPDTFEFPDWDDDLREALGTETELFLESQLRDDRSVSDLITADYTFLNDRLAAHYGIPDVYGSHFRRVTLPGDRRLGLLGQASIMLVTSFPNRTSPVVRGKWLLENLLGYPPPPPPAAVPDLPPNDKDQQPRSIRARLEEHRKNPACAGCHAIMDPLGFSLENFDAIGRWRTEADGVPVDTTGSLPDGTQFNGPVGLRDVLMSRRESFAMNVTEKLLTFALGRGLEYYDMPVVRKIVKDAAPNDYRWSSLIQGVTTSVPFKMRTQR